MVSFSVLSLSLFLSHPLKTPYSFPLLAADISALVSSPSSLSLGNFALSLSSPKPPIRFIRVLDRDPLMATVSPPADQAADLLKNLSLDSQAKTLEIPEPTKKTSAHSGDATNVQIQPYERSMTPLQDFFVDPAMCYHPNGYPYAAHYYGYDGTANEWDDFTRYMNPEGVEVPHGVYGDNGSVMYHPGYGYPYGPYSPAGSPVPAMGHDGNLYGAQHYQYPTQYFQPLTPTSAPYNPTSAVPAKGDISSSATSDQAPLSVDTTNGNSNGMVNGGGIKGNNGSAATKQTYQNGSYNSNGSFGRGGLPGGFSASGFQDPRYGYDGMRSPIPWLDVFSDGQHRPVSSTSMVSPIALANNVPSSKNQSYRPNSHYMGLNQSRPMSGMNTANGYMNKVYPNKVYGQYGSTFRSGFAFGSNGYDSRLSGRGWSAVDGKYKPRGRNNGLFGNENIDGLNELNRGPRAKGTKNQQKGFTPVFMVVKGQNVPLTANIDDEKDKASLIPDREQYNKVDFPESYSDAKFFIIKSYSEDDVHKSIKYNVWASTPNGNKKLDAAYQEAQQKSGGCPILLLFSVNTSGQFVGVAEMVGPVDFHKNFEYWQQDKWNGCFPVKWHIVKDVPNSLLKHITLENNENKPVTNSRDTQEVKLEQGLQVLKIFKDHSSRTCILDDFSFYEGRQNTIQEKKAKQQQYQKQMWEGKPTDERNKEEGANGELKSQKSSEVASDLVKESVPDVQTNGDVSLAKDLPTDKSLDTLKGAKSATEEKIVPNGVVNGC